MKLRIQLLSILGLALAFAASADTLRLTTGQVIYGQFVTRTPEGIQFTGPDGVTNAYPPGLVASLTFGPVPTPPPQAAQMLTLPAGTDILVQTTDELDTSYTQTGQIFSATLATNLNVNGSVVARLGSPVYGQVILANSAGRATGRSKLQLQLTQLVISGNPYPIVTSTYDTEGKQRALDPAGQEPRCPRPRLQGWHRRHSRISGALPGAGVAAGRQQDHGLRSRRHGAHPGIDFFRHYLRQLTL